MSLSLDLRKRLVEGYENQEGSIRALAQRFKVSASTVWRLLQRKRTSGTLTPQVSSGRPSKFDRKGLKFLKKCLEKNETLTLNELAQSYRARRGISVSIMAVHRACKRLKLNYKKNLVSSASARKEYPTATSRV